MPFLIAQLKTELEAKRKLLVLYDDEVHRAQKRCNDTEEQISELEWAIEHFKPIA